MPFKLRLAKMRSSYNLRVQEIQKFEIQGTY